MLKAAYDYEEQEANELSMQEGDAIYLLSRIDDDWWLVKNAAGLFGLVPASYLESMEAEPSKAKHLMEALNKYA